jgi:hypothetical protein
MGRRVDIDNLITADAVAGILGLSRRESVIVYLHRYEDFPRPVLDAGIGHPSWWLRQDVERWQRRRQKQGRLRERADGG